MEREKKPKSIVDREIGKVIEWENLEHELARLCSLSSALDEAKQNKQTLEYKLESLIQAKAESLNRSNKLEEMGEKLEYRKSVMGNMSISCKVSSDKAKKFEENLCVEVRSLLAAGTRLSVAKKGLQESNRLLAGERGYIRLKHVQRKLRARQRYMVSQVSLLYPVKISAGPAQDQELEAFPGGNSTGSKPTNQESLTILGLRLTMLPFTKMSFFTNKNEVQKSATALGYVAHAVSLLASYLKVPLRYPLRLGASRSYIKDRTPCIDSVSSDFSPATVEFPLFLEGQETTKAAYAVFLLNKDLEQLLNFIGVTSLGPRHVLANLKELIRSIQSPEYIEL